MHTLSTLRSAGDRIKWCDIEPAKVDLSTYESHHTSICSKIVLARCKVSDKLVDFERISNSTAEPRLS